MSGNVIDDRFIDVDFPACPEYSFGCPDAPVYSGELFGQSYEEKFGTLSPQEIEGCIDATDEAGGGLDLLQSRIYDQKNEGSCTTNALGQGHETLQALQYGLGNVILLSAISAYKQIGRSAQSGATIPATLKVGQEFGFVPLDTPENRERFGNAVMPHTGFSTPYPAGAHDVRKNFVLLEADVIRTVAGIKSALCRQHPVVVGRQGHAILYVRLMRRNRSHVSKYANSWRATWGDGGYGYDTENQIRMSANWAFAIRAVRRAI